MNQQALQNGIAWPEEFKPDRAPIHVLNELDIAVSSEIVWKWLIRATLWPTWYPNSANVRFINKDGPDLKLGTSFRWKTFGVNLDSTVLEYVPNERLAWNALGFGVNAYHAWLITKTNAGCHVLTEETQYGFACRLGKIIYPHRMYNYHQIWLEQLELKAKSGLSPNF